MRCLSNESNRIGVRYNDAVDQLQLTYRDGKKDAEAKRPPINEIIYGCIGLILLCVLTALFGLGLITSFMSESPDVARIMGIFTTIFGLWTFRAALSAR